MKQYSVQYVHYSQSVDGVDKQTPLWLTTCFLVIEW